MSDTSMMWLHMEGVWRKGGTLPQGLIDYKFYCFDGEPRFLYVSKGFENHATARVSFLTMGWEFAPFNRTDYEPFEHLPPKPESFDEMVRLAKRLSSGIPFVRVDLYERGGRPVFSEMTLHPCAGFMPFVPESFDWVMGGYLGVGAAPRPEG